MSTAADRDVSLIEQLVGPVLRQRGPGREAEAGQNATQIATLLLRLHRDLLEAGLAEAGLSWPRSYRRGVRCTLARECGRCRRE